MTDTCHPGDDGDDDGEPQRADPLADYVLIAAAPFGRFRLQETKFGINLHWRGDYHGAHGVARVVATPRLRRTMVLGNAMRGLRSTLTGRGIATRSEDFPLMESGPEQWFICRLVRGDYKLVNGGKSLYWYDPEHDPKAAAPAQPVLEREVDFLFRAKGISPRIKRKHVDPAKLYAGRVRKRPLTHR